MAKPIPFDPPQTRAVLPLKSRFTSYPFAEVSEKFYFRALAKANDL
jgi:hypothetical protein